MTDTWGNEEEKKKKEKKERFLLKDFLLERSVV